MYKFIENIIGFSLKNHVFILFMTGVLFVAGIACYQNTPIEAYPDVTNTRAKIIAQWPGRSAEEVEKFVTLPIMQQLNTIPRKRMCAPHPYSGWRLSMYYLRTV